MARSSKTETYPSTRMVNYVVLRKTKVLDDSLKLPRPKLTQDVLLIASKEACMKLLEEISLKQENQSTDIVEVELSCVRFIGQKTTTSTRANNGKR